MKSPTSHQTIFEGLKSSLAHSPGESMELQSGEKIVANAGFQSMNILYTGSQRVNVNNTIFDAATVM